MKTIILAGLCLLMCLPSLAQEESLESLFKVDYDTPLTLDLEAQKEEEEPLIAPKKKKVKKNVFFGVKTKKGFAKTRKAGDLVIETFHVLKEFESPPLYTRDFYWLDVKNGKVVNALRTQGKRARVLHGPYRKILAGTDQVLEEGWYYKGMKHRRWVRYNRHDILQEKKYWWKGWPQDSKLAYYNFEKTKLKEVIPVHYGEKNGAYWAFHPDGSVAVRGEYKFGHKVGMWKEYYDGRSIKREVIYPEDPFQFDFIPYISKEWARTGKIIYDREKTIGRR